MSRDRLHGMSAVSSRRQETVVRVARDIPEKLPKSAASQELPARVPLPTPCTQGKHDLLDTRPRAVLQHERTCSGRIC